MDRATDARQIPANARVAATSLQGQVTAERFVDGDLRQLAVPIADLLDAPGGARTRQLLHGEAFLALEDRSGFTFGQAPRDGYVGYVQTTALGPHQIATHWVAQRTTHVYTAPDIKAPELGRLSFGSKVSVLGFDRQFGELQPGRFVPLQHLRAEDEYMSDPASVAELFLGTPYLWGGNSGDGIDCSGLVQAACLACGIECARDSDQQFQGLGAPLPDAAPLQRGDLVFWRGHVGLMLDTVHLLHANAHHMAVAIEPLSEAIARISENEFGAVLGRKRL